MAEMTASTHQPGAVSLAPGRRIAIIAWVVVLLVSSLGDILCFELTGAVPFWLLFAKAGLLAALIILASGIWKPITALRPFFVILLTIALLTRANTWLLNSSGWLAWQDQQSFTVAAIAIQLLEMTVALFVIAVLFLLKKHRREFFLVRGEIKAVCTPVRLFGQKAPGPLWSFGLVFTLVVIGVQFFLFILPLSLTADKVRQLLPLIPVILLLAVSNGFNEEVILRAAPISTVYQVVGRSNAIWMAAVLFGLQHYIGGIPSGLPGVLTTAFLGWFFGKCMLDSRGFFWPWLFHAVQDILPFTLMAAAALRS